MVAALGVPKATEMNGGSKMMVKNQIYRGHTIFKKSLASLLDKFRHLINQAGFLFTIPKI